MKKAGGRSQDRTADFYRVKVDGETRSAAVLPLFPELTDAPCGLPELPDVPLGTPAARGRLGERLTGACELWRGPRNADGYGRMSIGKNRKVSVHRYAWERAHGPIPEGLSVLHLCDEPACVNIDHLVLGTQRANMADRQLKRRTASGARNGRALLSEAQVLEIRRMRGRVPATRIAQLYGVSVGAIHSALSGENWKHLPMNPPGERSPRPPAPEPEGRVCRNCERPVRGSMSTHWQKCLKETA